MQWLAIGISGVTCGGKTTLARQLYEYFINKRNKQLWKTQFSIGDVELLSQDDYFLPVDDLRHKWVEQLNVINFELLSSLDMKQLLSDITWTIKSRYMTGDLIENAADASSNLQFLGANGALTYQSALLYGQSKQPQNHKQRSTHSYQQNLNPSHMLRNNSTAPSAHFQNNKINILLIEGFLIFNQPELLSLCQMKFHLHIPYEKCFERRRKRSYDPPDVVGYFEMCVWPHYERNFLEYRDRKDIHFLNGEICKEKIFHFVLEKIALYFEKHCDVAYPPPYKQMGIGCSNGSMNLATAQMLSPTMLTNLARPMDKL